MNLQAHYTGVRLQAKIRDSPLLHTVQNTRSFYLAPYLMVLASIRLGVNRRGLGTDHSPLSRPKFKNERSYTSNPNRLHNVVFNEEQLYLWSRTTSWGSKTEWTLAVRIHDLNTRHKCGHIHAPAV